MSDGVVPAQMSEEDDVFTCVLCDRTLRDPMLLECLHSACQSCTGSELGRITCPVCQVTTDNSTAVANLFVSSLSQHVRVLKNVLSCTNITTERNHSSPSVVWCYKCQRSLCVDCEESHNLCNSAHQTIPLSEQTILSELYRPPSRTCANHCEELQLICFTCQDGRCSKCAHDCYSSCHVVRPIDSTVAADLMQDRITQATLVLTEIKSATMLLQAHLQLPKRVAEARQESLAMFGNSKKTAIDSINMAYENAETSLVECWDALTKKSLCLQKSAESLIKRLVWTNRYCELALNTKDTTGLLPQLNTVGSALNSLLEEVRLVKEPVEPFKLVSINVCLPRDLDLITSSWFGRVKLLSDDFQCSVSDLPAQWNNDYHSMRVLALQELEQLLEQQKVQQEHREHERTTVEQMQAELDTKTHLLNSTQYELEQLRQQHTLLQEKNELRCCTIEQLQVEVASGKLLLASTQNEVKNLLDVQKQQQEQLEQERKTLVQLQADLNSKTQQLAPLTPLYFFNVPRDTFKGPTLCQDVAVTPQGRLLVAATVDGLKEYDSTNFREIATWKPTPEVVGDSPFVTFLSTAFGKSTSYSVRTVEALADGRAVVGLESKLVLLLRRDVGSGSNSDAWRVERRIVELLAPPRQLSAWGNRLLAALEDRYEQSTKSWLCGPGLVLLSLSDGESGKDLRRQKLEYNARSVELTDRAVVVASQDKVEVEETAGSTALRCRPTRKCYVVDCYSHLGTRLWRHASSDLQIMGVCTNSVGRVLYAAMRGSVIALSVDDGRELGKVIRLFTKETERPYAAGLDRATSRLMALITTEGEKPNHISVFPVLT